MRAQHLSTVFELSIEAYVCLHNSALSLELLFLVSTSLNRTLPMASKVQSNRVSVGFTEYNKMSSSLVELRVDYHLNRIMKNYRLNNFVNAIKSLPLSSRICEKLIEIMTSTENMIDRKLVKIHEGKNMLERLNALGNEMAYLDDQATKDKLAAIWAEFKQLSCQTEQITWALNSNKEHLRYVARIHVVPEVYKRSEEEQVRMRELFEKIVQDCDEVIDICRSIRKGYEMQLRAIYANVNVLKPETLPDKAIDQGQAAQSEHLSEPEPSDEPTQELSYESSTLSMSQETDLDLDEEDSCNF